MRLQLKVVPAVVLALIGTAIEANADPILFARVMASAENQDVTPKVTDFDDSGTLTLSDSAGPVDAAAGLALSSASITDGVLHTYASAGSLLIGGRNGQTATGRATYVDSLFLTSSSLATGTLVDLQFLLALDATSSDSFLGGGQTSCGTSNAVGSVYVPGGSTVVSSAQETSCIGQSDFNNTGMFTAKIGEWATIQVDLLSNASARAGGSAFADASHTLHFFINPVGDFTYTTASGNLFQSDPTPAPIPEPASLLLLGSGITAVAMKRLRGRVHRR